MAHNVRFTFSVSDTTRTVYNLVLSKTNRMVTLKTIFSVVFKQLTSLLEEMNVLRDVCYL